MARILVFQHVPYEPLGLLDPMLREHRHRVRYVNFGRPDAVAPNLAFSGVNSYAGLIVLGGPMNIGQESDYPHLDHEKEAIRQAVNLGMPVLGICLGAQLLASALDAKVYPANKTEIGWHPVYQTDDGKTDPVTRHFGEAEQIFQWHGHTFDIPEGAICLLRSDCCPNQAFRYGDNAYGFQFHLEVCRDLIERWLTVPQHRDELSDLAPNAADCIRRDNESHLPKSRQLADQVFGEFIDLLPPVRRQHQMNSR